MATKNIAWNTGSGNITLTYQGQGDGPISVQSDANDLSVARSQQITIETTNGSPVVTKTVTISQAAKPFTPVINDYTYTGSKQTVTLQPGTYIIECWGASGGGPSDNGGKGGYSKGTLVLGAVTTVYIYAGGQGNYSTLAKATSNGGFNGGGKAYNTVTNYACGSGGGASDVRVGTDSYYARVIVAGGGGGYAKYTTSDMMSGGAGGGTSGVDGIGTGTGAPSGKGGSQSSGGTSYYGNSANSSTYGTLAGFGVGGGATNSTSYRTNGGGGGWYGGGYSQRAGAGGGSGYVLTSSSYKPSGYLLDSDYYLSDAETKAGDTSFPSTSGGTETGHSGNGYVRITRLS